MNISNLRQHLEALRNGGKSVDEVLGILRDLPFEDLDFAKIDHHRPLRTGFPEVVLGRGKTPEQVSQIVESLSGKGNPVLVTKTDRPSFEAALERTPAAIYIELAGMILVPSPEPVPRVPGIVVLTAGTADLPVAEEAAVTADLMGNQVVRVNDVGVAGLHRLLDCLPVLREANVIVAVAGMEAAITSVVAGLVSAPVVTVPTSVGYGASFDGLAALLGMLNSCAPGVGVVNIDNGFGGGYLAAQINARIVAQAKEPARDTGRPVDE
ncbi:MAG: 1-(5-phosphoribosyl)-5-amino-4-imidazole-carboxylate carboxylase [SAR202 cluster bacterium Io17-Chloro-G9]|nr:MAG: 1-(5-phosphoribosyl)-5-amino-4-imidazole-carboxylate carboxylase [SAR202 cluster bacterium Io17-Chloro-G9]